MFMYILLIVSLSANFSILFAFFKKNRRTIPDYFIANLCICGIVYSFTVNLPRLLVQHLTNSTFLSFQCTLQVFGDGIFLIQNATLALFFIDRYATVKVPFLYKAKVRPSCGYNPLGVLWVFEVVYIFTVVKTRNYTIYKDSTVCLINYRSLASAVYSLSYLLAMAVTVLSTMTFRELANYVRRQIGENQSTKFMKESNEKKDRGTINTEIEQDQKELGQLFLYPDLKNQRSSSGNQPLKRSMSTPSLKQPLPMSLQRRNGSLKLIWAQTFPVNTDIMVSNIDSPTATQLINSTVSQNDRVDPESDLDSIVPKGSEPENILPVDALPCRGRSYTCLVTSKEISEVVGNLRSTKRLFSQPKKKITLFDLFADSSFSLAQKRYSFQRSFSETRHFMKLLAVFLLCYSTTWIPHMVSK